MTRTTCRDVAFTLAEAVTPGVPYADYVTEHLSRCPKCVTFERQLVLVNEAVKHACQTFDEELPPDFETRLLQRLRA